MLTLRTTISFFILIIFLAIHNASAQSRIVGKLVDTVNFTPMAYGTVSLVRDFDSTLATFVFTRQDGSFTINTFEKGTFRLVVTRARFIDLELMIDLIDNDSLIDFGDINLTNKANLLQEIIIKERSAAIRVRGDTTEFLVDSFLTNPNSNVEDLLKKLPGIRVDKDGKIIAQGQEVKKVLVDGEEFFGNDPTVATRNIKAENVEKVQVFEQKSEQANFTGIDDGQRDKTINLQIKEEARRGYFGKLGTANGTQERYEHEAMFNRFKNKQKVSAFTLATNTNRTRLDWDEQNQFGGGTNTEFDEESGYFYSFSSDDDWGSRVGIPQTVYSGAHFSDKWNDKNSINLNYTRKIADSRGFDDNYSTYILPDTLFYNNQFRRVRNRSDKHAANVRYEWKPDSQNTFRIKLNYSNDTRRSESSLKSENRNGLNALVNENIRLNVSESLINQINSELVWMRKFMKKGRSLSLTARIEQNNQSEIELVQSDLYFYNTNGGVVSTLRLDQIQNTIVNTQSYRLNTSYTEPLAKDLYALIDYQVSRTENQSTRNTNGFNNGEYNRFIDTLSNNFSYLVWTQKGGISLRYVKKKVTAIAGAKVAYTLMEQTNLANDSLWVLPFLNIFPTASINYKLKNTTNLSLRYDGSTRQPRVQQIQPLQDFSNPLLIRIGNTNLRQSFRNNVSLSYNSYKPITGRSIYANLKFSYINDDFASSEQVDEFGRRVLQTVNVNGNTSLSSYMYFNAEIKPLDLNFQLSTSPNMSRRYNFINQVQNQNFNYSYNLNPELYKDFWETLTIEIQADWRNNFSVSSIRQDVPIQYWLSTYSANAELRLKERFEFSTDVDYNVRQRTAEFDRNLNNTIWNMSVRYRALESKNLIFSIEGYDILNQQIGFNRTITTNFINEHVYNILQRYFMIRIVWNFTKGGAIQNE